MVTEAIDLAAVLTLDSDVGKWSAENFGIHPRSQILGRGSFGVVLAGCRLADNLCVAVKLQRLEPVTLALELSCAQLLAQTPHPNLAPMLAMFQDSRLQIFASVTPQALFDLRVMLRSSSAGHLNILGGSLIRTFAADLVCGATHLHQLHIIHRDIKPGNCMVYVVPDGSYLRLGDFGCSRVEQAGGMTPGLCTSWYRAPELFLERVDAAADDVEPAEYTRAVDVWSVGCVIAEMILCRELFAETTDAKVACLIKARLGLREAGGGQTLLKDMRAPMSHKDVESLGKDFYLQCLQLLPSERPPLSALVSHLLVAKHGLVHRLATLQVAPAGGIAPATLAGGLAPAAPAGGLAPASDPPQVCERGVGHSSEVLQPVGVDGGSAASGSLNPKRLQPPGSHQPPACDCNGWCKNGKKQHPNGCRSHRSVGATVCDDCRCQATPKEARSPPKKLELSSDSENPDEEGEAQLRLSPGEQCLKPRRRGNVCGAHVHTKWSLVLRTCRRLGQKGLLDRMIPCDVHAFLAAKRVHRHLATQFIAAWLKHPIAIGAFDESLPEKARLSAGGLLQCLHKVSGPQTCIPEPLGL
jgi:serine/threonine protein kinase